MSCHPLYSFGDLGGPIRKVYAITKQDLHGWAINKKLRRKAISRLEELISNPETDTRTLGIAIRNLAVLNAQNMQLDDEVKSDTQINIKIIEESEGYQG